MRQHYITRSYLAAFTDPSTPHGQEPYLWVCKRDAERPYARAPKKLAVKKYYYSFFGEEGERDDSVEDLLSRVESAAIPILRLLAGDSEPSTLTAEQRGALAYFIGLMSVRIPGFRNSVEKFAGEVMRKFVLLDAQHPESFARKLKETYEAKGLEPPENAEELRRFILSGEYTVEANPLLSLQSMVQLAPTAAQYANWYNWRILRSPEGCRFITSDRPLVLVSTMKQPAIYGLGTGWETPWMEATLPLSPHSTLLISRHHPEGVEDVGAEVVAETNLRTASFATEEVYSSTRIDFGPLNRPVGWTWWNPISEALDERLTDVQLRQPHP